MPNLNDPVLPGSGASDYERYLRTDELLALQKPPGEMAHRDELLFQTIHQTAELWLKLASFEVETAITQIDADEVWPAVRLLRRATRCLDLVTDGTMMLEHLAPWDYHGVRRELGHGSGFDSPGTHELSPLLGQAFGGCCPAEPGSRDAVSRAMRTRTSFRLPSGSSIGISADAVANDPPPRGTRHRRTSSAPRAPVEVLGSGQCAPFSESPGLEMR
jgi:hypothetical protein